jgi:hypothetical protein
MMMTVDVAEIYTGMARLFKPRAPEYSHYREKESNVNEIF